MPESQIEQYDHKTESAVRDYNIFEIGSAIAVSVIGSVVLGGTVLAEKFINHDSFKGVKKEFTMLGSVVRAVKNGTPKL